MNIPDTALGLIVGVGLAAACGFRVFVPLLVMSIAVRAGALTVAANMQWIGSNAALVAFGAATAMEIAGYYVPWIDNLLDTIATPAAVIAGILATASMAKGMDPMLQWAIAVIVGGGAAASVQVATVVTRAASTATTGGVANPVVATAETTASAGFSILIVSFPVIAIVVVLLIAGWVIRRLFFRHRPVPAAPGASDGDMNPDDHR